METNKSGFNIPVAILVAGIIVAGAIIYTKGPSDNGGSQVKNTNNPPAEISVELDPVTEKDHSLGDVATAKAVIVEYSDLECYFCKSFQTTVNQLTRDYVNVSVDGKKPAKNVAWIYRHFPLTQIHPNAQKAAIASECVAELGGNQKFFGFIDQVFASSEANGSLAKLNFADMAVNLGLDRQKFETCSASNKYNTLIENSIQSGFKAGVGGTPSIFILVKEPLSSIQTAKINALTAELVDQNGERLVSVDTSKKIVSAFGALPYEALKPILEIVLGD